MVISLIFVNKVTNKDGYEPQSYIMEDDFFNTTPRKKFNERIIVIYKDGGVLKLSLIHI